MSNAVLQINREMSAIRHGSYYVLFWPHTVTRYTADDNVDLESRLVNKDFQNRYYSQNYGEAGNYYQQGIRTREEEDVGSSEVMPGEGSNEFYEYPRIGEKVVCWQVITASGVVSSKNRDFSRFLYYYDREKKKYVLFRNVISPTFHIDPSGDGDDILMCYWTNINAAKLQDLNGGSNGWKLENDKMAHLDEKRFTLDNVPNSTAETRFNANKLVKVRCTAMGHLVRSFMRFGQDLKEKQEDSNNYDFFPLFNMPQIIGYEFEEQEYESPSGYRGIPVVDFIPIIEDYGCAYGVLKEE